MEKIIFKKSNNDWVLAIDKDGEIMVYDNMPSAIVDVVLKNFYATDMECDYELTFELKKV